jgi:hypothetical protein
LGRGREIMAVLYSNLVLCIAILVLGVLGYAREKKDFILYIGIAFGVFGLTHLLDILGLSASLFILIIILRSVAYLIVIFSIYRAIIRK